MLTKHDKKGPELLIVDESMLIGCDNIANMFKAQHDEHNYDFMQSVKTALVKYPVIAKQNNEMAAMMRTTAKALIDSADFTEQILPLLQRIEKQEEKQAQK
jgi:hypothetical protein